MRLLPLLALAVLLLPPLAAAQATPEGEAMHCGLPTSVECVIDWVEAAGDGRWCAILRSWLPIQLALVACPVIW